MKQTRRILWLIVVSLLISISTALAVDNIWTNTASSGRWDEGFRWSAGAAPSTNFGAIWITNANTKTVLIDSATDPGMMTISNLTLSGPVATTNTLSLINATTNSLRILSSFTLGSGGSIQIVNSTLRVDGASGGRFTVNGMVQLTSGQIVATNAATWLGSTVGSTGTLTIQGGSMLASNFNVGYATSATGTVWLTGGQLVTTNDQSNIGLLGSGCVTVSNATWKAQNIMVANGTSSAGTLTVADGGIVSSSISLYLAGVPGTTGTVWLAGGNLVVTNGSMRVGFVGVGQMTVSNGTWLGYDVYVGQNDGSNGRLTIAGGTNIVNGSFYVGLNSGATGTVTVTGGELITTNNDSFFAFSGDGQMTVSNGLWKARSVYVGYNAGSQGTLTIAGGTNTLTSLLFAGLNSGATGTIWLTGGQLIVTNNITYIGYCGTGQMIVSNGLFQGNSLWVGVFAGSQGTLTIAGGINKIDYNLFVGTVAGSSGELRLSGGELVTTSLYASTFIGESGNGRMTVDGGLWRASYVNVANSDGSTGTLTINGGTNLLSGWLRLGVSAGANGTLQLNNGLLVTTNDTTCIGRYGTGQATVNGGTWLAQAIYVGDSVGSQGTLTINGGTITLNNVLILGNYDGANGIITMTGGQLIVTNSATDVGSVGTGQFYLYGGTFRSGNLKIGQYLLGRGTMLIADGSLEMSGPLTIAETVGSQGSLYVYGGQVIATNAAASINIGTGGDATMYMRGGTVNARQVNVGDGTHPGTLYMESGTLTGGSLIVTPSGILQLYGTTISSLVTNQGVIQIYNNPVTFHGGLDNLGNLSLPANQIITVQGGLGNEGGVIIAGNASVLNADNFRNNRHNGIMFLNSAAQLNVTAAWTNNGAIELTQGIIGGGAIQNASLIEGVGAVLAPVVNNIGGTIRANGGLLALVGSSVANQPGGIFEATDGSTLRINRSFLNQGVINNRGGDMDFGSNTLTNQGTLTGYGGFKAATTINDGRALFSGGNVNVYGAYINSATRTTEVRYATAAFFGAVTNNSGAVFKNTSSAITFFSTFYNNGIYFSDPATNTFHADLLLGETGKLQGGAGDVFVIGADLASANPYGLDLADAKIVFDAGSHSFTLAGAATIGALALDNDATLTLVGGDLIVGILEASTGQFLTAQTIYYDPSQNPDLDGQTYSLAGGGSLVAVPEPSSGLLAVLSLAVLLGTRAKRTQT